MPTNNNDAKAARLDQITQRAARETARLEGEIKELLATAKSLADVIAEAAAYVCEGSEPRGPSSNQINLVEPYARELAIALRALSEKRARLSEINRLIEG
jgi:hypothetical protein